MFVFLNFLVIQYPIDLNNQIQMMKLCIIVTLKLLLIWTAVYYLNDPQLQNIKYQSNPACLKSSSSHKLCAQCYKRDQKMLKSKGYQVVSAGVSSVLKIHLADAYLTCSEMLQFVDFGQGFLLGEQFQLQALQPITRIMGQMGARFQFTKTSFSQSEYIIEPWYNQLVVYNWNQQESAVTSVDSQAYTKVQTNLLYFFNFVLLVVLVAWMADRSFLNQLPTPLKLALGCILMCFELYLLGIFAGFFKYFTRLLVLNLGLLTMRVNNLKVLKYLGLGLIMTYFPQSLCIYVGLMTILVAYYGKDQSETHSVKLFLVIFYALLMFNYSYWYQYVQFTNDIPSLIIDVYALTFIITGIFLLPHQRSSGDKIPSIDPQIKSISLNGFDDNQDNE